MKKYKKKQWKYNIDESHKITKCYNNYHQYFILFLIFSLEFFIQDLIITH